MNTFFLFTFFFVFCIPPLHRIQQTLHPPNFTGKVSISSFYPYYSSISLLQLKLPSTAPIPCYSSSSILQLQIPTRAPVPYYSSSSLLQLQFPTTAPITYYSPRSLLQLQFPTTAPYYSPSSPIQLQLHTTAPDPFYNNKPIFFSLASPKCHLHICQTSRTMWGPGHHSGGHSGGPSSTVTTRDNHMAELATKDKFKTRNLSISAFLISID